MQDGYIDRLQLIELYSQVGYAPKEVKEVEAWVKASKASWHIQDKALPGNCVALSDESGAFSASFGLLPISSTAIYGHSGCMNKSVSGALGFFEGFVQSKNWMELIPGISHYLGSYALRGRFVTRLHVSFETTPQPTNQVIVYTDQLFKTAEQASTGTGNFSLVEKPVAFDESGSGRFMEAISSSNSILEDWHKTRVFEVRSGDSVIAKIISHSSPKCFTAADMFDRCWVLCTDESHIVSVATYIRNIPEFKDKVIEVIRGEDRDYAEISYEGETNLPAFFTYTHKDEVGLLIASIARSFYTLMTKYGTDASKLFMSIL